MASDLTTFKTESHEELVKLTPTISNYSATLNAHNRYFCRYYPSAVMVFSGCIDTKRFLDALGSALNYFPFLFCQLHDDGNNLRIMFDQNKEAHAGYVICELATCSQISYLNIHESTLSYLPQHVPKHLYTFPDDVNGLIMIQFRVTQCRDGFVLAYTFNHACLDQASILYFFKYLTASYHQINLSQFIAPHLLDTFSLLGSVDNSSSEALRPATCSRDPETLPNAQDDCTKLEISHNKIAYDPIEFDTVARSIGRLHKITAATLPVVAYLPIQITFNKHRLHEYCQASNAHCSSNDLINAFLTKIYALQHHLGSDNETVSIEMATNCRPRLGLNEATIGNIVATIRIKNIPMSVVRSSSLIDLSLMIRQHVKTYTSEDFLSILNWYHQSSLRNNSDEYMAEYLVNPSIIMTTNWQGFDYSQLVFDDSALLAILQPPQPFYRLFLGVITFDNRWDQHIILNCQIPKSTLNKTQELCKEYAFFVDLSIIGEN